MVAPPNGLNGGGLNQHNNHFASKSQKQQQSSSLLQQSLHNSLVIPEDEQLDSASALAVSIANGKLFFESL